VDTATVDQEVTAFLDAEALEVVRPPRRLRRDRRPLFYHGHFTIEKKEKGTFRHIINMRRGNEHVLKTHFKMESLDAARALVHRHDWAIKVDIKSAFTHVGIHPDHRDFFRIRWRNRHLRFRAMPFGYSDAPRIFTMVMRAALKPLRARGVKLVAYLDDILLLAPSKQVALAQGALLVRHLHRLGFDLKAEKCVLAPTQTVEFLGFSLDLRTLTVHLPSEKIRALRRATAAMIIRARDGPVPAKRIATLLGKLRAAHPAFSPAHLLTRSLQWDLRSALRMAGWSGLTTLPQRTIADLEWWHQHLSEWTGRLLFSPTPDMVLTTDASKSGWGAWLSTPSDPETPLATTFGFWSRNERNNQSSNWKEQTATLRAIESFSSQLRNKAVLTRSDNLTNVANICRGGGRSVRATEVARELWQTCESMQISLRAEYHPGLLNTLADSLSRIQWDRSDWKLNPALFGTLSLLWGPFEIDLFASAGNAQLQRYFSRYGEPPAEAADAFKQRWRTLRAYANPPFALIGQVLRKIEQDQATVTVVIPEWRSALWWPLLFPLLVALPRRLPSLPGTFLPSSQGNQSGVGTPPWGAICVRLSGLDSLQQGFRTQLHACLPTPLAKARMTRMIASGDVSRAIAEASEQMPWPVLQ
jgi:hypothetical protein